MVKALLFDLDGTLLNTSEGIFRTADRTAVTLGLEPCRDSKKYAQFVGPPLHVGFNKVYGLSGEDAERASKIYRSYYPETGLGIYSYYDGLLDVVATLKKRGYLIGVATLKNESAATRMIASSRFSPYVDVVHGSDERESLTKKDIVLLSIRDLLVNRDEAVLIGDSESDEKGAWEAGVSFLAVSWGFGFPEGCDKIEHVDRPEELLDRFGGTI